MKVAWHDRRCVVCVRVPTELDPMTARTYAHVIPESVGGDLSSLFLCKRCNSEMGRMESLLARDMAVRRRVKYQLQARLPKRLAEAILKGEEYFVDHNEYGRITAVVDDDGFLQPRQTATVKDDRNTLAQALADLERIGASAERKNELREQFERAAPGDWIDVRPDYRIQRGIDWSEVSFSESLNDPLVGHEVPLGIAYLYLALCLRERVYDEALAPVRGVLRQAIDGDPSAARALLPMERRMGTDIVEPTHLLRAKNIDQGVRVTLQVFRDITWPVDFAGVRIRGQHSLYLIDLEHGGEQWASRV